MTVFAPYARAIIASDDPDGHWSQLICSVDDAWLHDGFTSGTRTLQAAVDAEVFNEMKLFPGWEGTVKRCGLSELQSHLRRETGSGRGEMPGDDIEFALSLIQFCRAKNYGLCLCSFEFFYLNVARINRSENAILFDIRHQYMEHEKECGTAWKEHVRQAFRDPWKGQHTLGWFLYFNIKLSAADATVWPYDSLRVDPGHLLIVSSREDVDRDMADFRSTLIDIAKENEKSVADCSHFLLPKSAPKGVRKAHDFASVSDLFNRSFRHAATFEAKRDGILSDMKKLWDGETKYAHVDGADIDWIRNSNLSVARWIDGINDDTKRQMVADELRSLFRPRSESGKVMRASTFWRLLQHLAPAQQSPHITYKVADNLDVSIVAFEPALVPGVFLLLGLAKVINKLDKGERSVTLFMSGYRVQLEIKIYGEDSLVALFQKWYGEGRRSDGAAAAICELRAGMPDLYHILLKKWPETERKNIERGLTGRQHGGMFTRLGCRLVDNAIEITVGEAVR